MIKTLLTTMLLFLGTMATAQVANNCNTYQLAQQMLTSEYGEYIAWEGVVSDNMVIVQLWTNPETGTWTHLVVSPDGNACVVADGMAYTFVDPPIPGEDM